MSEPRRLLEQGADDLRTELLRSALGDQMPSVSLRRALTVAAAASSTVAAAGSASAAAGGGAAAATIVKWIGIGMVAGAVTAGGAKLVTSGVQGRAATGTAGQTIERQSQTPRDESVRAPLVTAPERATSAVEPQPRATEAGASQRAHRGSLPAAPSGRAASEAVADSELTTEEHLSPADVLRRELSLIDQARHAVASGHAEDGLRALDRYDRRYPQGRFGPEATALRVEALLKLGRRAEAVALSNALLRTAPTSPAAARVRRLLETAP